MGSGQLLSQQTETGDAASNPFAIPADGPIPLNLTMKELSILPVRFLDDVSGWKWTVFVHPEDVEGIVAKWRACLATGETFEYETRVRRADGEYRWMFHRKVPLRDERGNID